jgi:hypothetical protein
VPWNAAEGTRAFTPLPGHQSLINMFGCTLQIIWLVCFPQSIRAWERY